MKKQFFLLLILLSLLTINVISQIDISIIKVPNHLSLNDSINKEYTIEITNKDTITYIFYNMLFPYSCIPNECVKANPICQSAAFSWFNIYNSSKKLILDYNKSKEQLIIPLYTYSLDSLDSIDIKWFKDLYKSNLNDKLVIKPGEKRTFFVKFNIAQLDLSPGNYFLKYNYVNGLKLKLIVDEDLLYNDEKDNNAKVFYGCIQSNLVEIKVNK